MAEKSAAQKAMARGGDPSRVSPVSRAKAARGGIRGVVEGSKEEARLKVEAAKRVEEEAKKVTEEAKKGIPTTAEEFQVSLLERMGRKPRLTPTGVEYLETPERKVTITPAGRVVKAPPSAKVSPEFVESFIKERVRPVPIPAEEPLPKTAYEERAERLLVRQERFEKGMERVGKLAGFLTFARGKPYEERKPIGQYAQLVVGGIAGIAPYTFAGIPLAAGKAAYISESLIRPETRLMTIQEATRGIKVLPRIYDPRTPTGLATLTFAFAAPLPRALARYKAARAPLDLKLATRAEISARVRPEKAIVSIKPTDFAARIGKMEVVGTGLGKAIIKEGRILDTRIDAGYAYTLYTRPKVRKPLAELKPAREVAAALKAEVKLEPEAFRGFGAYVSRIGKRRRIKTEFRVTGFRGFELVSGEFPRYLVTTGELMPFRRAARPSLAKAGIVSKIAEITEPERISFFEAYEKGFAPEAVERLYPRMKKPRILVSKRGELLPPRAELKPDIFGKREIDIAVSTVFGEFMKGIKKTVRAKYYESLVRKQISFPFVIPRTATIPRAAVKPRTELLPRVEAVPRIEIKPRIEVLPMTETIPRFAFIQRTELLPRVKAVPRLGAFQIITPTPTIPRVILPPPFLLPIPSMFRPKRKKRKVSRKLLRYQPSLVPVAEKIFGRKPIFTTGLEIRPLPF